MPQYGVEGVAAERACRMMWRSSIRPLRMTPCFIARVEDAYGGRSHRTSGQREFDHRAERRVAPLFHARSRVEPSEHRAQYLQQSLRRSIRLSGRKSE
jgi:hypothetical protein